MRIAPEQLEQIVEHARREAPNECIGLVAVRDGVVTEVAAMENTERSPRRFNVDGPALSRWLDVVEKRGDELGAIYHSHTRSDPVPSQTDENFAAGWPGVLWVIVGLGGDEPEVRTWSISGGEVTEAPLEVT
jgi:[CysO sulfur-carrier protein]-S-L-cysteine hydrolase